MTVHLILCVAESINMVITSRGFRLSTGLYCHIQMLAINLSSRRLVIIYIFLKAVKLWTGGAYGINLTQDTCWLTSKHSDYRCQTLVY